jgi:hypothetical protein
LRPPRPAAPRRAPFAEVERVEPFGAEALLAYTNRVDPGLLGRLFGSPETVAGRLEETVHALAARVERLRATEPSTLIQLVSAWRATLKGP